MALSNYFALTVESYIGPFSARQRAYDGTIYCLANVSVVVARGKNSAISASMGQGCINTTTSWRT
jgi:hypothetical protein